jgi:hypothetical protein
VLFRIRVDAAPMSTVRYADLRRFRTCLGAGATVRGARERWSVTIEIDGESVESAERQAMRRVNDAAELTGLGPWTLLSCGEGPDAEQSGPPHGMRRARLAWSWSGPTGQGGPSAGVREPRRPLPGSDSDSFKC